MGFGKVKLDWFLTGMALAIVVAAIFPAPGAEGGWLHPELLTKLGVAVVFFLNGAGLSFKALKDGIFRWRLHLIIQSATFILFPLIGGLFLLLAGRWISPDLRMGLFYLCAMPSTVSSSVGHDVGRARQCPGGRVQRHHIIPDRYRRHTAMDEPSPENIWTTP